MRTEESRSELGIIKIHKKVIASIASLASMETEGVRRVGGNIKTNLYELIGQKGLSGIKVDIDKNGEVKLEVPLIVKYGFNIPEVANKTQENIHRALEKMTNLVIRDININIQGIERG
ncbi:MAG: Asp23/Gls24 family envelope stress response protein [Candidatus Omnitrophota bacterium]|nr:Asp23/Gls24 family envelope stress response protein [Candidatus Omnitrophota bacterium]